MYTESYVSVFSNVYTSPIHSTQPELDTQNAKNLENIAVLDESTEIKRLNEIELYDTFNDF